MRGQIITCSVDYKTRQTIITAKVGARPEHIEKLIGKDLDITMEKHREKRGKDANALYWACVGEIAVATKLDKNAVHLELIKSYGVYEYRDVLSDAVDRVRKLYRTVEKISETTNPDGTKRVQMLCYFGTELYTVGEFSRLIDGTISEMEQLGIAPPPRRDVAEIIKNMEGKDDTKREST